MECAPESLFKITPARGPRRQRPLLLRCLPQDSDHAIDHLIQRRSHWEFDCLLGVFHPAIQSSSTADDLKDSVLFLDTPRQRAARERPPTLHAGILDDDRRRIRARIWTNWRVTPGDCLAECAAQILGVGNIDHGNRLNIAVWPSGHAAKGWDEYFALPQKYKCQRMIYPSIP